jgi:hypothetical protein
MSSFYADDRHPILWTIFCDDTDRFARFSSLPHIEVVSGFQSGHFEAAMGDHLCHQPNIASKNGKTIRR